MKHLKNNSGKKAPGVTGRAFIMLLRAALFALIFCFTGTPLWPQCSLNCRGADPTRPLSVVIDEDCEVQLDMSLLLDSSSNCPGDKLITVRDTLSNVIVSGSNAVSFDAVAYHGQLLRVTIENQQSGLFCNSFVTVADTFPPTILCLPDTVSCLADTSIAALGYPIILDNCSGDIAMSYADTMVAFPCPGPEAGLIERTWTATDIYGNTAKCVQPILLQRQQLDNISFPPDTILSCGSLTGPDIAGRPTLNGDTLFNGNACFLTVFFEDDTIPSCSDHTFDLLRTWTIIEDCSDTEATEIQLISVVDTVAPLITCPPPLTAAASPGSCYARVTLPMPTLSDNCDSDATFYVNTSYGAVGLGPHSFVPIGTHTLQYTAIDACQNTRVCTTTLDVVDEEPPHAVCDDAAVVAIPSGGYGTVGAITFDEGSEDNCATTLYFKARRLAAGECDMSNGDDSDMPGYQEWFDDQVRFCCEDIGEQAEVVLRVYEIDPGAGPVDPVRETPNGDLFGHFTECRATIIVQDMLPPRITCPRDTAVDCSADYSDLYIFGTPSVTDNCGAQLIPVEEFDLNDCGAGTISRTFQAVDPSGNTASCTQVITITKEPLTEEDIIWPENYTLDVCGAAADPDDLPAGHDRPKVVGLDCTDIAILYEDDLFNIAAPACYKILRRWTVIDWCDFDPEHPDEGGRFSKVQVIKVEDNDAPVLDCPASITRGISNDCSGAQVSLPPVTAQDCNPNILITNDSPYAASGGANASGTYPLGATVVTFSATDRCGNLSECEVSINVVDNRPPSPICIVGLSINLADDDGDGYAVLQAQAFDGGSTDNCTASPDLRRTLRLAGMGIPGTPPATSELAFSCADRGNQTVEFWVTDLAGNSSYCVTVISVQDNSGLCPQQASGMIAGNVQTEMGEYVDNVNITASGSGNRESLTSDFGFFEILDLPYGGDYSITAQRNDGPLNGVSTLDLVLISQHILGIRLLDSPYKQIAADVNRSGSVSTLDMISLRKIILGMETEFPNGNTPWRFIDAGYEFPNPQDPFAEFFPEAININDFVQSEMEADFVAVKVGDVDNSAVPNTLLGVDGRAMKGTFTFRLPEQRAQAGALLRAPFTAAQLNEALGYQFSLSFDTEHLEFVGLETGAIPGLSEESFNLQMADEGRISTSWHHSGELEMGSRKAEGGNQKSNIKNQTSEIFTLVFRARKEVKSLRPLLSVGDDPTPAEAYDTDGALLRIRLEYEAVAPAKEEKLELYQNRPNPFSAETTIGFQLPDNGAARLSVINLSGKLIYEKEGYFSQGYNEIRISAAELPASGVLYYQLKTDNQTLTRKMILL